MLLYNKISTNTMMHRGMFVLTNLSLVLLIFGMPHASATTDFNDRFDLGWTVKILFQDIGEGIASITNNPDQLEILRLDHIQDAQQEINKREANGKPIPAAILNRIDTKTEQLKDTETFGDTIYKTIKKANELNEIRLLHGEFKEIVNNDDPLVKSQFNTKVNNLQTWKDNCNDEFDINDYKNDEASLDKLSMQCPGIKTQTISQLKTMLYG